MAENARTTDKVTQSFIGLISEDWTTNKGAGLLSRLCLVNYRIGRRLLLARRRFGVLIWPFYLPFWLAVRLLAIVLGCSLPFGAELGRRIRFRHGLLGVFISGKAVIGDDCTILHQVTIGSNVGTNYQSFAAPRLGRNVFVGAGAKIIGNLEVGDNVVVGAQALVITSVAANSRCHAPVANVIPG